MMTRNITLVLHALLRAGKDTLAEQLAPAGFTRLALGDPLYAEVAAAFGVAETALRDPDLKELPAHELRLGECADPDYVARLHALGHTDMWEARSPRFHLDHWGTEYRREQDPMYWGTQLIARAREVSGPIVLTDIRIDDYEVAQRVAAARESTMVVAAIVRPAKTVETGHRSTKLWGPERIHFTLVNVEGDRLFMYNDLMDTLANRTPRYALETAMRGKDITPGLETQGEVLLRQRANVTRLIKSAMKTQDALNAELDPQWRNMGWRYPVAFAKEASEVLDHTGWEWWKKNALNTRQVTMELADMLCFGLSEEMVDGDLEGYWRGEAVPSFVKDFMYRMQPGTVVAPRDAYLAPLGRLIGNGLQGGWIDWRSFGDLVDGLGISRFAVLKAFFAKVALNSFRWAHGYREGTYIKVWTDGDGAKKEDNEFLWGHIAEWEDLDTTAMYEAMIDGSFTKSLEGKLADMYVKYAG